MGNKICSNCKYHHSFSYIVTTILIGYNLLLCCIFILFNSNRLYEIKTSLWDSEYTDPYYSNFIDIFSMAIFSVEYALYHSNSETVDHHENKAIDGFTNLLIENLKPLFSIEGYRETKDISLFIQYVSDVIKSYKNTKHRDCKIFRERRKNEKAEMGIMSR